jgi:hypothetical protein
MKEIEYDQNGFMKHMSDLKASTRATSRIVRESIKRCGEDEKAANKLKRESVHKDNLLKKGMITDLNLAINQMHSGREAGRKKGVHRRGVYDIDTIDPLYIQMYQQQANSRSLSTLSRYQKMQIEDALSRLSNNERECFVMSAGECWSFGDIANHLDIEGNGTDACTEGKEEDR